MTPGTIKIGETDITFSDTIYKDGQAFDCTGATIGFWIRNILGGTAFSGSGEVAGGSGSGVQYPMPLDGSFPQALGTYYQEWSITTSDETPLTFRYPEDGYNQVRIIDKLG